MQTWGPEVTKGRDCPARGGDLHPCRRAPALPGARHAAWCRVGLGHKCANDCTCSAPGPLYRIIVITVIVSKCYCLPGTALAALFRWLPGILRTALGGFWGPSEHRARRVRPAHMPLHPGAIWNQICFDWPGQVLGLPPGLSDAGREDGFRGARVPRCPVRSAMLGGLQSLLQRWGVIREQNWRKS